MTVYVVTLRRDNGRYVKSKTFLARYPAKQLKSKWEQKYDETYYVEIEPVHP